MEPTCRIAITVTGRVQGVGFRFTTRSVANSFGLTGYVKNLPDGSVYIEAQGSRVQVESLMEWCRKGPDRAVVESVDCSWIQTADEEFFKIR